MKIIGSIILATTVLSVASTDTLFLWLETGNDKGIERVSVCAKGGCQPPYWVTKQNNQVYVLSRTNDRDPGVIVKKDNGTYLTLNERLRDETVALCETFPGYYIQITWNKRPLDCARYMAAELSPILAMYMRLQEAYIVETGMVGSWSQIGMTQPSKPFFHYSEIPNGIKVIVPEDMHQCSAGNYWLYYAEAKGKRNFILYDRTTKRSMPSID